MAISYLARTPILDAISAIWAEIVRPWRRPLGEDSLTLLLPSPLQILSQPNIHQFPLVPRFAIRFNQPLCEFLEFDVRGVIALF